MKTSINFVRLLNRILSDRPRDNPEVFCKVKCQYRPISVAKPAAFRVTSE